MKKTIIGFICLIMAALMFSSCTTGPVQYAAATTAAGQNNNTTTPATTAAVTTGAPETTTVETSGNGLTPRDPSKGYRVLFIGNSFTYYNDMNAERGIFYLIAKNSGYKVSVSSIYKGGYYLHQFLDPKDEYGAQVIGALASDTKYDFVIIQEQSAQPISNPADFYTSCRRLKALVDSNGAEMYLYSTWGYKTGHSSLSSYGKTTYDMEMKLRAAYVAIGDELNVPVVYAGAAMSEFFKTWGDKYDVYHTDAKHPSKIGSTLIAWTIFGTIFGVDPATFTYNATMTEECAKSQREIASKYVLNKAEVTDTYKVTSIGKGSSADETTAEQVEIPVGVVDSSKTIMLTTAPSIAKLLSVIQRDATETGNGWTTVKGSTKTFSGIRGDKDQIASIEYSDLALSDAQKADIADIGYGVSIIGIDHMDSLKKGTNNDLASGRFTSVGNLINGHWGSSYMAALFFDRTRYNIKGEVDASSPYTGLITLNFGSKQTFDSIGYFSGSLDGFAQAQEVFVSDDGQNWTKVESACYDSADKTLASVDTTGLLDPWNQNKPTVGTFFSMNGASGKYIRIAIIKGGNVDSNNTGLAEINTREIAVFGK